jgi:CheY-like chemotaxis protein/anti-sigma regulatory factor (Ser/Thr protein kinase)
MTRVLVVDDSAADLRLICELLEEDPELEVGCAVHGVDALAKIAEAVPDLVVTDLVMPEMDGLELVKALKQQVPLVPVVLVTARGNEEIAVRALQQGAASYVPKRGLAGSLLGTVHTVLSLSQRERSQTELMGCLARNDCRFILENDASLIRPLATLLQEEAACMGLCDRGERTRLGVALEEALANALYHGNLEVDAELREKDRKAYDALVARRREEPPYCDRRIHVEANLSRHEAVFVVRDDGAGFDPSTLPDPADPASLERATGRGVLLMRTLMDEVVYNDAGNAVTLVKRCASGTTPAEGEAS